GLGGMSGSQKVEESRTVETDAPAQIIYRIDKYRYLTLENYISCDKGGQVYYNDTQRGIKTHLGWDIDFNDFSYRLWNSVAAYQGTIVNGADNGYLAFPGASTRQYCGSGRSERGCPVFFFFSADYGKSFIYKIIAEEYRTPERFSQLKVVVANDGVYLRDGSQTESVYSHPIGLRDLHAVNKLRFSDGTLISVYDDWQEKYYELVKEELIRKKMPYANEYGPRFHIFDYIRTLTPPKTHEESNLMADELSEIRIRIEDEVYSNRIEFPKVVTKSINAKYSCDKNIKAKTTTYTLESSGKKEVVKNEQ
ncbi:T6SS immunity protein Tli3 family protein, partial [Enterobacter roggenkampii]|uniref:T6SS immunity protein Tli3 family protein n=2 Tax=Enterobacter TaxID=547 RepID=UPI0013D6B307